MKFVLNKDKMEIKDKIIYNSGSVNYYEADVEYDESWQGLNIGAIITSKNNERGISIAVINNKFYIDRKLSGTYYIGFVGYTIENEIKNYQISSNFELINIEKGAGEIETENEDLPTPTEWEIYIQQIQELIDSIGDETNYNNLLNKPKINNVELIGNKSLQDLGINIPDVSNFITRTVNDLANYYKKTETYTQEEVRTLINAIESWVNSKIGDIETILETLTVGSGV